MKTNNKNSDDDKNVPPVHTADCGRVRASVWETDANGGKQYKVTITRSFKQENGEWARGRTFFENELTAVIEVAARTQRWIERRQRDSQAQLNLAGT